MAEATKHLKSASAAAAAATHMDSDIARNLRILGLHTGTRNTETIKKAFRNLAMASHPNTSGLVDEKEKKAAEERFKKVREAFVNLRAKLGL
jgi:preprotein translocase subunit Sec63